jgi:type I restriction enzyme, S subunit
MAGEWRETTLGEVTDFISGGTPSKGNPAYWGGLVPWVSAKDMKQFCLVDTEDHLTEKGVSGTKLAPAGTTLLLVRGMTLLNDVPICVTRQAVAFNQDIKALRAKPGVRNDFLPYLLLGNKRQLLNLVDLAGHGTGRLNTVELNSLNVVLPSDPEQLAIVRILGTLDDKIELNRRMIETLEVMARSLFKSWFVDFDPVRAKSENRDPKLPKNLADLFPNSVTESELGKIPATWNVKALGDLIELAYGKALKEENRRPGDIAVYGSNGQVGCHTEKLASAPGIIVGRKGNPGVVTWSSTDFFAIDTTFYVVPKGECKSLYFLYYALRAHDLASLGADSAVPGLNRNMVYMSQQLVPSMPVLDAFDHRVRPIFDRIQKGNEQSSSLSALRDTLLPKLISGQLRLPDAERIVGEQM